MAEKQLRVIISSEAEELYRTLDQAQKALLDFESNAAQIPDQVTGQIQATGESLAQGAGQIASNLAQFDRQNFQLSLQQSEFGGLQNQISQFSIQAESSLLNLSQISQGFARAFSSSIAQAVQTGEFNFRQFAASVSSVLINLAGQLLSLGLNNLFGTLGNAAISGLGGIFGGVLGFAEGGRPPLGRVSLVGEKGPELFVPSQIGTILPNAALGRTSLGLAGNTTINQTFQITVPDQEAFRRMLSQNDNFIKQSAIAGVQAAANKRRNRGPLE